MTNIIPSKVPSELKINCNTRRLSSYTEGRVAHSTGKTRDDCPYPIWSNEKADRLAWMTGHLDEEFK